MYNMGTASRNGLKHALTLEQRKQIMVEAAEQRYVEFLGGETKYTGIETISPRPMLFITGENAHSREFSEDAYRLAAEPKELYIVPGAGHVDLYDRVSLIPFSKLESFFKEYLKK